MTKTKLLAPLIALCLLPWFIVQSQLGLNGDVTWLMTAAQRLLSGDTMSGAYYEVNPPLSVLYHVPPVLLGKILPLPIHYIVFLYFAGLVALSTFAINAILKRWDFVTQDQRIIFICGYLAANTIFTTISLGERDHIALLGLMPLVLAQLSLTWKLPISKKLLWPVLIFGSLAILIKPHFGLLPVLLLLHRMASQKRIIIMRDPDFMALAAGTLSYIALIWFFFRDYITVILPDVLNLYISNKDYEAALPPLFLHTYLFVIFLGIEAAFSPLKGFQKKLLVFLYAGAVVCLIPYAVQMKGLYYHLIPALIFFFCAFSLSLHSYASSYLKDWKYLTPTLVITIFALAYMNTPPLLDYPKHQDFKNLPLSHEIAQCEKPCPYFIFHSNMEIMHPSAFYDGQSNASRFPTLWFLPELVKNPQKNGHYIEKYGAMLAEDFKNYRPKMLMIGQYRLTEKEEPFDFSEFFSINSAFIKEWRLYEKDRTITFNQRPYFTGTGLDKDYTLTYDIYLRKHDK